MPADAGIQTRPGHARSFVWIPVSAAKTLLIPSYWLAQPPYGYIKRIPARRHAPNSFDRAEDNNEWLMTMAPG